MAAQTLRVSRFGLLANAGALLSVLMCYGEIAVIAALSLAGIAVATINPHLQAVLMVGFALLAVFGLAVDLRQHRNYAPLVLGATGLAVMAGTLYVSFDPRAEFMAYAFLITAVFMNQHAALKLLTDQLRRRSDEISEKNKQLEAASQHKSQFLANMSHELRTPLNAILGYTELIVDRIYGEVPEKIRDVLERVQKSGRHLLGLINDVLDLSKIEAGQLALSLSDYSFADAVQSVVSSVESLAKEKSLRLTVDLPATLPVGRGDERRIVQVLLNLVGNAIKFTEAGEVGIRVNKSGGAFLVAVSDTGPGIPESQFQKIFEEFQQVDSSSTKTKGGSGLGLAIAKKIIEMHGGSIWVESTVGKGSTFTFKLSVRIESQVAA